MSRLIKAMLAKAENKTKKKSAAMLIGKFLENANGYIAAREIISEMTEVGRRKTAARLIKANCVLVSGR